MYEDYEFYDAENYSFFDDSPYVEQLLYWLSEFERIKGIPPAFRDKRDQNFGKGLCREFQRIIKHDERFYA